MSNVTLINYPLSDMHIASVHKAGCRDIQKDAAKHGCALRDVRHFAGVDAALGDWVDGEMQELGYTPDDVKIFSCARGL